MADTLIQLRVMSFNIAAGMTMDERLDLELTAVTIEKEKVDIVGLQEVEQHFSDQTNFIDQVKWLADRLDMYAAFGPNLTIDAETSEWPQQAYGNAILSRYPIKSSRNHLLKKVESETDSEQRGVLEANIEINEVGIAFFTTHLSLKIKQHEHNIEEVLRIIRQREIPAILTGDFNAEPNTPPMKRIQEELDDVFKPGTRSMETYKEQGEHGQKIDHIFCSRDWQVLDAKIIDTEASDHRPVFAVLQLQH